MVKNTQAGTPSANSDKIPMPRASAVVQHRTFDAGHPGIPRAGKNDDWESWKWDGRWWWGWRSKDGGWWSGEDWIKTEERTKTKSKEWSEELGIDSGEAKTEERTENDNEEWTKIEECTKGGGWIVLTAWECAKIEESWMKVSGQECKQEKEDKSEERDLPP